MKHLFSENSPALQIHAASGTLQFVHTAIFKNLHVPAGACILGLLVHPQFMYQYMYLSIVVCTNIIIYSQTCLFQTPWDPAKLSLL